VVTAQAVETIRRLNAELRAANRDGAGRRTVANGEALVRTRQGEITKGFTIAPPYEATQHSMRTDLVDEAVA
jgi:hypothetical protein